MVKLICRLIQTQQQFFSLPYLVKTPQRKKNLDKSSVDTPDAETPVEKKKNYWAYKNRDGPSSLGSKELPKV